MKPKHFVLSSLVTLIICPTILQLVILVFIAKAAITFESLLGIVVFMIFTLFPLVVIGIPSSICINLILKRVIRARLIIETLFYIVFSLIGVIVTIYALSKNRTDGLFIFDKDNLLIYSYGILCAITFQISLRLISRKKT